MTDSTGCEKTPLFFICNYQELGWGDGGPYQTRLSQGQLHLKPESRVTEV